MSHGKTFTTILAALKELSGAGHEGNEARHLNTLAGLVCGIVMAQSVQLPDVAGKTPTTQDGCTDCRTSTEIQIKRFSRWLKNEAGTHAAFFLPLAEKIPRALWA